MLYMKMGQYLVEPSCDATTGIYSGSTDGWNNSKTLNIKTPIWITLCTSVYCFIFWYYHKIMSSFIHFFQLFFLPVQFVDKLWFKFTFLQVYKWLIFYKFKWRKSQISWNSAEHANDMYITYWRITLFTFLQLARLQRECPPWPPTPWPVTWTAHAWL